MWILVLIADESEVVTFNRNQKLPLYKINTAVFILSRIAALFFARVYIFRYIIFFVCLHFSRGFIYWWVSVFSTVFFTCWYMSTFLKFYFYILLHVSVSQLLVLTYITTCRFVSTFDISIYPYMSVALNAWHSLILINFGIYEQMVSL